MKTKLSDWQSCADHPAFTGYYPVVEKNSWESIKLSRYEDVVRLALYEKEGGWAVMTRRNNGDEGRLLIDKEWEQYYLWRGVID